MAGETAEQCARPLAVLAAEPHLAADVLDDDDGYTRARTPAAHVTPA